MWYGDKVWVLIDEDDEVVTFFNTIKESFIYFKLYPDMREKYYATNLMRMIRMTRDELNAILEN